MYFFKWAELKPKYRIYLVINLIIINNKEVIVIMKSSKQVVKAFSLILQIGITVITSIFLSLLIGIQLDKWLNTGFMVFIFLLFGIIASFRSIYYMTKNFYAKDLEKEKEELQYFEDLKNKSKENKR